MNQKAETELNELLRQLQQTDETFDFEGYKALAADDEKLVWLRDLSERLQTAVESKEEAIAELESAADDLRQAAAALEPVMHRVKLSLGIETVEGQLALLEAVPNDVEAGLQDHYGQ